MLDLVLKGGTVVDGSGAPGFAADIGIRGDRIAAFGYNLPAEQVIECAGRVVAPGFIDTHSHSDLKLLTEPTLPMKLRQGITLEVLGQDGISVAPVRPLDRAEWKQKLSGLLGEFGVAWDWDSVASYLRRVTEARPAQDVAYLVPHGAIRQWVMGGGARRPTPPEMAAMRALLRTCLDQGACGMSTGLVYPPCCYASTAELAALAEDLGERGKPLVVHLRSESDRILDAVDEMLRVAADSGCAVHISHIKIAGRQNWGKLDRMLEAIGSARSRGLTITADQYPYLAGSTLLGAILPPWAHDGGTEATLLRLRDPAVRARLRAELADESETDWDNFWKWGGPEGILLADVPSGRHSEYVGQSLRAVARLRGQDPFEAAFDVLLEESMGVAMISFSQDDAVVEALLRRPWACVCTDGLLGGRPHPRAYGAFPRVLGHFVRERGTLTLEEAVRKMTSQAADSFGFAGVGLVREGFRANLVVFDPETVADRASFEEPLRFPEGIRDVLVGGRPVLRAGHLTDERPGKVTA